MRNMKGQAAMEYLMTYGWALVALIAVIALLMATGVFNPSYMVSEECTLQPDLSCGSYILYNQGDFTYLKFRVDNGLGYDIEIQDVKLKGQGAGADTDWNLKEIDPGSVDQGKNSTITFQYTGENRPLKGELMKMTIQLTYLSCAPEVNPECTNPSPEHTVSGRIVARTEQD